MTPEEMAAIRARDADDIGWTTQEGASAWVAQLRVDVRVLIAEVDRLTAYNGHLLDESEDDYGAGMAAERERIEGAVRALKVRPSVGEENDWLRGFRASRNETVDSVLAIIKERPGA